MIYTAFLSVPALSDPRLASESPLQVLHPATASLRRSRSRLWNVSHRPPMPTALLLMTTESVPAGTTRVLVGSPDSDPMLAPSDPAARAVGTPSAARSEGELPGICWVVGVMF